MNIRDDDIVSAVALVMEDSASAGAPVAEDDVADSQTLEGAAAGDIDADDAADAAHGEGAEPRGSGPVEEED
jgi:CBS domain-containing protein